MFNTKEEILLLLREALSIETKIDRGSYGSGDYLGIALKLNGETISETNVSLSDLRE